MQNILSISNSKKSSLGGIASNSQVLILFSFFAGLGCENPKVTHKVYSSTDATIVELVAFVGEFEVLCSDGDKNFPLFATINDEVVPVTRTSDISKYIVSWAEEPSNAKSGSQVLRFFDEAGFGAFRKVG